MSKTEYLQIIEISTEEQMKFLDAIQVMPKNGIALRGDPLIRAKQLQSGLTEPQINYIIFVPPLIRPKIWGKEAQDLYLQLKSAVGMAMVYADPWYRTRATAGITDPDFVSYAEYFRSKPDELPTITWFTEAEEGQFGQVINFGSIWFDYDIEHHAGDVSSFGAIPAENIQPTIVVDDEDIKNVQTHLLDGMKVTQISIVNIFIEKLLKKGFPGLISRKKDRAETLFLRNKRKEFRREIGNIMMAKLCERMIEAFKNN